METVTLIISLMALVVSLMEAFQEYANNRPEIKDKVDTIIETIKKDSHL